MDFPIMPLWNRFFMCLPQEWVRQNCLSLFSQVRFGYVQWIKFGSKKDLKANLLSRPCTPLFLSFLLGVLTTASRKKFFFFFISYNHCFKQLIFLCNTELHYRQAKKGGLLLREYPRVLHPSMARSGTFIKGFSLYNLPTHMSYSLWIYGWPFSMT